MAQQTLTAISTVLAILLGSGAVGGGFWKLARTVLRHAVAAEQARNTSAQAARSNADNAAATRELLQNHEDRLNRLEGATWPNRPPPPLPRPSSVMGTARLADTRARLSSPTR